MKKLAASGLASALLLGILFFTNPDVQSYEERLRSDLEQLLLQNPDQLNNITLVKNVADRSVSLAEYSNYYLFGFYETGSDQARWRYVGVATFVIRLDDTE